MGAARGVDEGLISGAFGSKNFQRTIHFSSYTTVQQTNIKANVAAMVQIGSVGGALMSVISFTTPSSHCAFRSRNRLTR
jgi:hypothetical protein